MLSSKAKAAANKLESLNEGDVQSISEMIKHEVAVLFESPYGVLSLAGRFDFDSAPDNELEMPLTQAFRHEAAGEPSPFPFANPEASERN